MSNITFWRRVLVCSLISALLGAAVVGGITEGIWGVIGAPFLVLFGWFYLPVIFGLNLIAGSIWREFGERRLSRGRFIAAAGLIAPSIFALIGIKEEGRENLFIAAFVLAALLAGIVSAILLSTPAPLAVKKSARNT